MCVISETPLVDILVAPVVLDFRFEHHGVPKACVASFQSILYVLSFLVYGWPGKQWMPMHACLDHHARLHQSLHASDLCTLDVYADERREATYIEDASTSDICAYMGVCIYTYVRIYIYICIYQHSCLCRFGFSLLYWATCSWNPLGLTAPIGKSWGPPLHTQFQL